MGRYQSQMKNETKLPKLQFAGEVVGNEWYYHDIFREESLFQWSLQWFYPQSQNLELNTKWIVSCEIVAKQVS